MDPTLLDVVLLVGATVRLIRLAVVDTIGDPLRAGTVNLAGRISPTAGRWAAEFWACPFCVGWWISLAAVGSWITVGATLIWQAAAAALTLSWLAGHAVARFDAGDD